MKSKVSSSGICRDFQVGNFNRRLWAAGQNAEMAAMSELYYIVAILGLLIWNELESVQAFAYILCVCV